DGLRVHAELDDLERNLAANRLILFRHEHHTASAFANLLEQFVAVDLIAGFAGRKNFFAEREMKKLVLALDFFAQLRFIRLAQKMTGLLMRLNQRLDLL